MARGGGGKAVDTVYPANATPWTNAGLMVVQRRRRWTNIKPALVQGAVLAGYARVEYV